MFRKDSIPIGMLYGLVLPVIAFVAAQIFKTVVGYMFSESLLYILCIGVNAIFFKMAIKREKDSLARGILATTFIYAFIFFAFYFEG